jgi:hypothetical protein
MMRSVLPSVHPLLDLGLVLSLGCVTGCGGGTVSPPPVENRGGRTTSTAGGASGSGGRFSASPAAQSVTTFVGKS